MVRCIFQRSSGRIAISYNFLLIVLAVHSWGVLQYWAVVGLFSVGLPYGLTLQF